MSESEVTWDKETLPFDEASYSGLSRFIDLETSGEVTFTMAPSLPNNVITITTERLLELIESGEIEIEGDEDHKKSVLAALRADL